MFRLDIRGKLFNMRNVKNYNKGAKKLSCHHPWKFSRPEWKKSLEPGLTGLLTLLWNKSLLQVPSNPHFSMVLWSDFTIGESTSELAVYSAFCNGFILVYLILLCLKYWNILGRGTERESRNYWQTVSVSECFIFFTQCNSITEKEPHLSITASRLMRELYWMTSDVASDHVEDRIKYGLTRTRTKTPSPGIYLEKSSHATGNLMNLIIIIFFLLIIHVQTKSFIPGTEHF